MEAFGHGADTEEDVFARMLEDGPDDFLAFDAELVDALCKMVIGRGRLSLFAFHHARGLPKFRRVSTAGESTESRMRV